MKEFLPQDSAPALLEHKSLPSGYAVHETGVQLSPQAVCTGCAWFTPTRASAHTEATDHARATGHVVKVDTINRVMVEVQPR